MVALTIGMPTYDDFDGVYFTVQALRLYHDLDDVELVVVDNYGCAHTKQFVEQWAKGRYVRATEAVGTAAAKNRVFAEATGAAVLCCDSHVLFAPDAIARLKAYYRDHPGTRDLLQGPLVYDDLQTISTHFDPVWRGQMWGIWGTDPRGLDPEAAPFEVWGQGMGVFSCRKAAWPGFNPRFRGFGGEEGYIHEKVRQHGGRVLCLPWLRWGHRFGRPSGVPYRISVEDKFRNYLLGFDELGLDLRPVLEHFAEHLPQETVIALAEETLLGDWDPARHERTTKKARKGTKGKKGKKGKRHGKTAKAQAAAMAAQTTDTSAKAEAVDNGRTSAPADPASSTTRSLDVEIRPREATTDPTTTSRRAIVCFVEDKKHVIQQALALRRSWVCSESADTDLVVMGPEPVLDRLPDDLVKIVQQPAADDPVWRGYRRVNSITCFNGAGAEELDRYTHIMRTDVDTFITPAWNQFYPTTFTYGTGGYSHNDEVRQRLRDISAQYGLVHRGLTNVGSTWYGPTKVVRRTCAFAEMMAKHIITHHFATTQGKWPGWYRGVSVMYSGEIAVNHCAPDAQHSKLLEVPSASENSIFEFPHIHCWPTNKKFSKHWFMGGRYTREDAENLDMDVIRDYCMALSFESLDDLAAVRPASTRRFPGHPVPNGVAPRTSSVEWPRVVVGGHGNLGNNLFRTMASVFLAAVLGARKLEGVHLPALGIATSVDGPLDDLFSIGGGHILPIDRILSSGTDAPHRGVVNTGYGQRFEYISGQRDFWRAQFDRLTVALPPLSDQEVVINIRAGEILKLLDRAYFPLPLDFYDVILEELGMAPVFVGQVNGDHPYLEKLRLRYPTARFIQGSALEDFELVRRSHTKILTISTFSWMAGWLGGDDSRVVMPVAGLFNPILQPQINLLPSDERFELRWFGPMKRDQAETSLDHFLESLSEASHGYPRVERSAYPVQDLGLSRLIDTRALPTTTGEWSAFIESVILQQRQCGHRKVSS